MRTLYDTINNRAEKTFGKSLTKENYGEWVSHWLSVARDFQEELSSENLCASSAAVNKIIRDVLPPIRC